MIDTRSPISTRAEDSILRTNGVVSVAEGTRNGETVVIVGVDDPAVASQIPGTIEGVRVVIETEDRPGFGQIGPPLVPEGGLPSPVSAANAIRHRPVPAGVSIAHRDITAGTSSFLATDGRDVYQLSNNHVLARSNAAEIGDSIVQPGPADGGTEPDDVVGTLAGYVPLDETGNTAVSVDVAWYLPDVNVSDEIIDLGVPGRTVDDPEVDDTIRFSGRTSGPSMATVDRGGASVQLDTGHIFKDVFRLNSPLLPGDSGSPIIHDGGVRPAGIGFASSQSNGYCCYASNIESESGLRLFALDANGENGENGTQSPPIRSGFPPEVAIAVALGIGWAALRRR